MQTPIYLDYNATTPVVPKVVETIAIYLTNYFAIPHRLIPMGSKLMKVLHGSAELINAAKSIGKILISVESLASLKIVQRGNI